jgi:hypothetical protein
MARIEIHNNFLDEDLFNECSIFSNMLYPDNKNASINTQFRLNILAWHNSVVLDSSHIFLFEINENENKLLYDRLKLFIESKINRQLKSIVFVLYTPCSHIPFHNDSNHNGGVTIYLNEKWDRNHGGHYIFESNNELRAIVPRRNMSILQYGSNYHSVSCTTRLSEIRRTIQCFF